MADSHSQQMFQMITAYWVSQIIGTLAQFGIPDRLAAKPAGADQLASDLNCDPGATRRLLRAAASVGIISGGADGTFTLTPLGETLRSNVPGSMRDLAVAITAPGHWLSWARLADAIRTGKRQTVAALGQDIFQHWAQNPEEGKAFTGAMANYSAVVAEEVARLLDTSNAKLVVDVGGASGTVISALLRANPTIKGLILELPHVVADARAAIASNGLSPRCDVVEGDFFESVPAADMYVIKSVLHDWDDEQSIRILSNCAKALRKNGRVVVVELVLPEDSRPSLAPLMDMNMLVLTPGRERTATEYGELLRAAGLHLDRVIETHSPMHIIEASAQS